MGSSDDDGARGSFVHSSKGCMFRWVAVVGLVVCRLVGGGMMVGSLSFFGGCGCCGAVCVVCAWGE